MASLLDEVQKQEANSARLQKRTSPVSKITLSDAGKDKQISAKVSSQMWEAFTRINKAQGLSNNSALNMVIAKYVRETMEILDM